MSDKDFAQQVLGCLSDGDADVQLKKVRAMCVAAGADPEFTVPAVEAPADTQTPLPEVDEADLDDPSHEPAEEGDELFR